MFSVAYAQWIPSEQEKLSVISRLKYTVEFLASDSLEGREAGTPGEIIARDFISEHFLNIGVEPYYPDLMYHKAFPFSSSEHYSPDSKITYGNNQYLINEDFTIVSYFGRTNIKGKIIMPGNGLYLPEKEINDYADYDTKELKDKIFLIDIAYPKTLDFITQDNYYEMVQDMIYVAIQKGAAGIILYHGGECRFGFHRNSFFQNTRKATPILYVEGALRKKLIRGEADELYIQIMSNRQNMSGYNVAARINNNAATTIVIGAHYDHLGYGSPISRHVGPPRVHPGADDNASGVAVMIELARFVKQMGLKNHNYVFVAFSAEEKGLVGSKAFIEDSICKLNNVMAMINLDMVGRMDTASHKVNVLGTGSTPKWDSLLTVTYNPDLDLSKNPSGTGGSDQLSFYMKNIPVLFFITGIHRDYHTPGDISAMINYNGMYDIFVYVANLLTHLENVNTLPFVEGEDKDNLVDRSYTRGVTLGVIPDHTFGGKGMRIDDVFPGRNAELSGIKAGDIVVEIDEYEVSDLTSYMKALSNYISGSKAKVKVLRGTQELILDVTF